MREGHRWLDSRSVLLTWVGDWGLWREHEREPRASVDTVTARVQQSSWAQDLWADFRRAIEDMASNSELTPGPAVSSSERALLKQMGLCDFMGMPSSRRRRAR